MNALRHRQESCWISGQNSLLHRAIGTFRNCRNCRNCRKLGIQPGSLSFRGGSGTGQCQLPFEGLPGALGEDGRRIRTFRMRIQRQIPGRSCRNDGHVQEVDVQIEVAADGRCGCRWRRCSYFRFFRLVHRKHRLFHVATGKFLFRFFRFRPEGVCISTSMMRLHCQ